jgi:tetratricopeptide (TPR) repeat protein
MIYAHVQSLGGECTAALESAETGIPTLNETPGATVHLMALSAQILALLQLGRFGQALRIIRASQEMAEKNGSDPWLFLYREAWLRTLAMDFAGAQRVCTDLTRSSVYPTGQAKAIGRLAAGLDALDRRHYEEARRCLDEVRDPTQTPKFFIHWYWRLHAHVGLTRACLQSGDLTNARVEANRLREAALTTADPNLHALAWDMSAQIAIAETNWEHAKECVNHALGALARFDVPTCAWRVHGTAWDLYRKTGEPEEAAVHRTRARERILALVNSFEPHEPLQHALLSAQSVRLICEETVAIDA